MIESAKGSVEPYNAISGRENNDLGSDLQKGFFRGYMNDSRRLEWKL